METLTFIALIFDSMLAVLLLLVAGFALFSHGLFRAIVLYITFGLLLALAWVRLNAPDIALAGIAIGAGLTGALLLSVWTKLKHPNSANEDHPAAPHSQDNHDPKSHNSASNQPENHVKDPGQFQNFET